MKICSKCKVEKPLSDFNNVKTLPDGKSFLCRECSIKQGKEYRDKNGDRYYYNQQTYRATPEGFITNALSGAKTRARKKGFEFSLTAEDLLYMMDSQDMKCAVSGIQMTLEASSRKKANPFKCSIDRIDSNLGYTKDNVRLVCWAVNQMKADRTDEEFKFWIGVIHTAISSQASVSEEGSTTIP